MRKTTLTIILLIALSNFITAQVTTINVTLDPPCITLGLPSFEDQVEFAFYPNPSNGVIYIEQMYIKEVFNPTIKIYDLKGILVYEEDLNYSNGQNKRLVLNHLQNGFYLLTFDSNGKKVTKKLVIYK